MVSKKQIDLDAKPFSRRAGKALQSNNRKQRLAMAAAFGDDDLLEDDTQIMLIDWLKTVKYKDTVLSEYVHHSPNGGNRNTAEAAKFRAMGTKAGYPDLLIDIARHGYHGLRIEMKRKQKGELSEVQIEWLDKLINEGYYAAMCRGYQSAKSIISEYMRIAPNANNQLECDIAD